MSRIKFPVVMIELHGVPAPKRFNLRVIKAGPLKEWTESGVLLGHQEANTFFLLKQLKQEGYVFKDAHQKMKPKGENPEDGQTPAVYLTFHLGGDPIVIEGFEEWLQVLFGKPKGVNTWANYPPGGTPMLSLNMVQSTNQTQTKYNLHRVVWTLGAEEGGAQPGSSTIEQK